jgi:hypothetical protein
VRIFLFKHTNTVAKKRGERKGMGADDEEPKKAHLNHKLQPASLKVSEKNNLLKSSQTLFMCCLCALLSFPRID